MVKYRQDDLESAYHEIGTPSPSPNNGVMSTASHTTSSPKENRNITSNTNGGDFYREPPPEYSAAPQVPHDVDYQQPALQISNTMQRLTDNSHGDARQHAQSDLVLPPLQLKKDTETEPAESHPEGSKPSEHAARLESVCSLLTHPNGVSIFPELSASEQEELSREAFDQAEESIIADDTGSINSTHGDDTGSDAGYDSDNVSSASTSAMSSVRDYMFENGRRYHRFREGSYNFPNDDVEQEREDMKHAMVKLLCSQKLHFAPIGDNPQEILDIGTGTGIWSIESKSPSSLFAIP
jgi:hypothetical protein